MAKRTKTKAVPKEGTTPASTTMRIVNPFQLPSIYTNFAAGAMTQMDLTIRFCELIRGDERGMAAREVAVIIMSPTYAKAVRDLLDRTIAAYENTHGPIKDFELKAITQVVSSSEP